MKKAIQFLSVVALLFLASCSEQSQEPCPIHGQVEPTKVWTRRIQVLTIEGDTATIVGGATCYIYIQK